MANTLEMSKLKEKNKLIINDLNKISDSPIDVNIPNKSIYIFNNIGELEIMRDYDIIVQDEILSYISTNKFDLERLRELLLSMAIDSESGQVVDHIRNAFSSKLLLDLIFMGLAHPWKEVRWQILELINSCKMENKATLIYYSLCRESDSYVLRVGLKILDGIDKNLSKEIALRHLESDDSYLRVLATEIIASPF